MTATRSQLVDAPRLRPALDRATLMQVAVGVTALTMRLAVLLRHGGVRGSYGYDSAVYFAAADSFVHGRMPYGDFVLLHPPGLMLALSPFAALTSVVSDPTAFAMAALAFAGLGAVNAVLVVRVCLRLGFGTAGAVVGGLFYGFWFGAVGAEYLARLEPLGNFLLLVGLLCLLRGSRRRDVVLAGIALGALVSTKIWWAVPVLLVVGYDTSRHRSASRAIGLAAGIAAAFTIVDVPFALAAPRAMWSSVIANQLGRRVDAHPRTNRLADISSVSAAIRSPSQPVQLIVSAGFVVLLAVLVRAAWRTRTARPVAVLLVVQLAVVLAAPSWFGFYSDYLAVALAVTVGETVGSAGTRASGLGRLVTGAALAATCVALTTGSSPGVRPVPGAAAVARQITDVRCVMSDSPMGLIELDALTRGLQHGCPNWVDVTGRTYGPDRADVPRSRNARWQRDLRRYLRSGQAVVVVRAAGTGLDATTWAALMRDGILACSRGVVVYRVVP